MIAQQSVVTTAVSALQRNATTTLKLALEIQQIPAPTFAEAERAAFVQQKFGEAELQTISQDDLYNVYGLWPGLEPDLPPVIVSAHTDTVFPADTDLTVRREGRLLYGPGLADNSAGVAALLTLAHTLREHGLQPRRSIWFVANTGEEGLGDLRGMQAVTARFGDAAAYIVLEGGSFGHVVHQGIGVNRYEIVVRAQGGHSWADFGQTSAIHVLGRLIAALDGLDVPTKPKTSYNVGVISGGRSINTIADEARCLLDLRSEDAVALKRLTERVTAVVESFAERPHVTLQMEQIGQRPAGHLPRHAELVQWAGEALHHVGCPRVEYAASSTDANIPLSLGYNAVCIGLAHSGNVHRLDEYLDPAYLGHGLGQLLLLALTAAER